MEKAGAALTELQFTILDGMADDYEDAEQLYIYANRKLREEQQIAIDSPNMLLCVRFPLRELMRSETCFEMAGISQPSKEKKDRQFHSVAWKPRFVARSPTVAVWFMCIVPRCPVTARQQRNERGRGDGVSRRFATQTPITGC